MNENKILFNGKHKSCILMYANNCLKLNQKLPDLRNNFLWTIKSTVVKYGHNSLYQFLVKPDKAH